MRQTNTEHFRVDQSGDSLNLANTISSRYPIFLSHRSTFISGLVQVTEIMVKALAPSAINPLHYR